MVSVVILTYNRCSETLFTLQKLKDLPTQPFPVEIIVVDNASTDNTSEEVRKLFPEVRLLRKEKNAGVAGWNLGFEVAAYKYLLTLDDDSHIESGLTAAIEYMEKNPKVGILALNITSGPYLTDKAKWQNGKIWQHEERTFGFIGCGAVIRTEVYKKIGGFAEWLGVYAHEWDYGLRCMQAGYEVRYFKTSSVAHRSSPVNRTNKRVTVFKSRNELAIAYKYFDHRWHLIFRMWLNNLKRTKKEGLLEGYYYVLGGLEFLKIKNSLTHTPVAKEIQHFFISRYWNTFPFFSFLKRKNKDQVSPGKQYPLERQ